MAKATVTQVELNFTKSFNNGKSFTGTQLSFITEKGGAKKEFIFSNAPYMNVVKDLAAGDVIDAVYVKNGVYFNLNDVKLIEKGAGEAPKFGGGSTGGAAVKTYGKSPQENASIIRQNALTNSVNFVTKCVDSGAYKKGVTPDLLITEVLRIAKEFASFSSGELQVESLKEDLSAIKKATDAPPFEVDGAELDI